MQEQPVKAMKRIRNSSRRLPKMLFGRKDGIRKQQNKSADRDACPDGNPELM